MSELGSGSFAFADHLLRDRRIVLDHVGDAHGTDCRIAGNRHEGHIGTDTVLDDLGCKIGVILIIPVIEDDEFVLWESQAIVRYLCRRYGQGGLHPDDPRTAALADQWMQWTDSRFMAEIAGG